MKALIVEDHLPTSQILMRSLSAGGHQVEVCHNAEDAIQKFESVPPGHFQLCVIDQRLPGIDGFSLCRWIRDQQHESEPYIIVGTGSDHAEELANSFEAGADDYIEKPYQLNLLELRFAVAAGQISAREERRRLNSELNREKDLIAAVFETAAAFIVALNPCGRIAKVNQATCELTGREPNELAGAAFCETLIDEGIDRRRIEKSLEKLSTDGDRGTCRFESQFHCADDEFHFISWHCRLVEGHTENEPVIVCVGTDITERRRMEAQLAFLAERDPLTSLYNRSRLEPAVQEGIEAARAGIGAAILYIDLDDFKTVNDSAGHAAGDDLLQIVSSTLARNLRPSDVLIRMGGDEFVVVLTEISADAAREAAERIRDAFEMITFVANGRSFRVSAAIGLVILESRMTVESALGMADAACYASKENHQHTVAISGTEGHSAAASSHDVDWYERITGALAENTIDLWHQPLIDLRTGEPVFHEALLRIRTGDHWSRPREFMHAVRRFNLLREIDRCVIRNVLEYLKTEPSVQLTVNISGRSAGDPRMPTFLINEFRRAGVDPSALVFEITESDLISDLPDAVDRLTELRNQGFRFALDDFGKGYSSFRYLRELPLEMVKIDGTYTRTLLEDHHSAAFLRCIAELAHNIGILCVAEHVEGAETLEVLRGLGIDLAQGYHLGFPRPIPRENETAEEADRRYGGVILPS